MKIVYCYIDFTRPGGIERIVTSKANYLADVYGYDVTIITTDQQNRPNYFQFSDKIKQIDLGVNYCEVKAYSIFKRLIFQFFKMRRHKNKLEQLLLTLNADIVVSTYCHEFTILPLLKDTSKKIGEIHFSKEHVDIENTSRGMLSSFINSMTHMNKLSYVKKYHKFVVLTKGDLKNWESYNFGNIEQIYNSVPFFVDKNALYKNKRVISVGRLVYQKGMDLLIKTWAIVTEEYPDWHLDIYGDGEMLEGLNSLIKKYSLEKCVTINPPTPDIIEEYMKGSIYVSASRYEGFAMVVLEAMMCGLPCVSFDFPMGPSEMIENGKTGFLVENENTQELADKIKILMKDVELRKEMGLKSKERVELFSPSTIMDRWNSLFISLLNGEN